ncbi:hypothetical protein KVV02_002704 [Mortierella alpina]|uniref:Myb-like domain-containing protein n=1 Tax=Mortierella alpina TaxID=64518 RepID=A0A9P8D2E9_MORAP|nr:hypothetical protein KVV02_002704 [Mortierella alpina]
MTNVEPAQESHMEQAALEAPAFDQQPKQEPDESETAPKVERVFDARQQRINELRLKFCVRDEFPITKNMIHSDGTLNQDYFRPPKGAKAEVARKWTDKERELLIKGIEKHGIGHFREISEEFLPLWSGNDLRVKSMRLMGRQNLQLYKDWKGTEQDMAREFELNKAIGLKYGAWKAGTLVADDDGMVAKAIEEQWPNAGKKMSAVVDLASEENSSVSTPIDEDVEMECHYFLYFYKPTNFGYRRIMAEDIMDGIKDSTQLINAYIPYSTHSCLEIQN